MGIMKETMERLNRVEALVQQLQETAFSRDSSSEGEESRQDIDGSDSDGMNEEEKIELREEKME